MKKYDAIVIGSGSGGLTCAYTAKGLGKRVLLIDKNKPGGECTWSGCIPSKSLIHVAKEIAIARKYNAELEVSYASVLDRYGVSGKGFMYMNLLMCFSQKVSITSRVLHPLNDRYSQVEDEVFEGTKISSLLEAVLHTPIEGISNVRYHTNDTLSMPRR